jgi:hypothetical protein
VSKGAAAAAQMPVAEPAVGEPPVLTVDGRKVVEVGPVYTPLPPRRDGTRTAFRQYLLLTLEDGRQGIGCGLCPSPADFVGDLVSAEDAPDGEAVLPSKGKVQAHINDAHRETQEIAPAKRRRPGRPPQGVDADVADLRLGDIVELADHLLSCGPRYQELMDALVEARAEKQALQKKLDDMARAIGKLGFVLKDDDE